MGQAERVGNTRYKSQVLTQLEGQRNELWKLLYRADDIVSLLGEVAQLLREIRAEPSKDWQYRLTIPAEPKGAEQLPD